MGEDVLKVSAPSTRSRMPPGCLGYDGGGGLAHAPPLIISPLECSASETTGAWVAGTFDFLPHTMNLPKNYIGYGGESIHEE